MEINAKEARNKISALLDLTQKGEEISIFRRGKKVALLVPPDRVSKGMGTGTLAASLCIRS